MSHSEKDKILYMIGKEKYNLHMDITFKNKRLMDVFNSSKELSKEYGAQNAKYIRRRMAVLDSAPTLAEVSHRPPERRHELNGKRKGEFAVDVKQPYRLTFLPSHNPVPVKEDGGINLDLITAIEIQGVEDYH